MQVIDIHVHSEYSIKKAICSVAEIVNIVKDNPDKFYPAVSITDYNNFGSWVKLSRLCSENNLKPVFAAEFYVEDGDLNYHITAIAKNDKGVQDLISLHNRAWENLNYIPRVKWEWLYEKSENIIYLSGCINSKVSSLVLQNNMESAEKLLIEFKEKFKHFYIEIVVNDYRVYPIINRSLIEFSKKLDIPYVITNDCRYINSSQAEAHKIWVLSGAQLTFANRGRSKDYSMDCNNMSYYTYDDYLKCESGLSEEEINIGLNNAVSIVKNEIEDGTDIDKSLKIPRIENSEKIFRKKVSDGYRNRNLPIEKDNVYIDRIKHEVDVIVKAQLQDYFLCVLDYVDYAKSIDCLIGERGSGASSLVNYCLGITNFDPVKARLLFERFLSEDRVTPIIKDGKLYLNDIPDIDLDFSYSKRDMVKEHIMQKYGGNRTCHGGNFQKAKIKSCLQDIARVFEIPLNETFPVTKGLEEGNDEEDVGEIGTVDYWENNNVPLRLYFEKYPNVRNMATVLLGKIRAMGRHASAAIVIDRELNECLPVYIRDGVKHALWIEGVNERELTEVGIAKFDILGLKNLDVVKNAIDLINSRHGTSITVDNIPLDDPESYQLIANGKTHFIFQLESNIGKNVCKIIKPNCFGDIVMITSLIRPGPHQAGIHLDVARKKNGEKSFFIPNIVKPILSETYSSIVYQEQMLLLAQVVGGMDGVESNQLRKILVKTKDEIEKKKKIPPYKEKWDKNGWKNVRESFETDEEAKKYCEDLWVEMENLVRYSFAASHAYSYSLTSVREAYLKVHYPIEFISVALSYEKQDELQSHIVEMKEYDITVQYPDINLSEENFVIQDSKNLIYPISLIKNVTSKVLDEVKLHRPYTSFDDFHNKVTKKEVNKRKIISLILANAFRNIEQMDRFELYNKYITDYRKEKETVDGDIEQKDINLIDADLLGIQLSKKFLYDQIKELFQNKYDDCKFPIELKDDDGVRGELVIVGRLRHIKQKISKNHRPYDLLVITDDLAELFIYVWGDTRIGEIEKGRIYMFKVKTFPDNNRLILENCRGNVHLIA